LGPAPGSGENTIFTGSESKGGGGKKTNLAGRGKNTRTVLTSQRQQSLEGGKKIAPSLLKQRGNKTNGEQQGRQRRQSKGGIPPSSTAKKGPNRKATKRTTKRALSAVECNGQFLRIVRKRKNLKKNQKNGSVKVVPSSP